MAVPSFGPSHRIEISKRYISYNECLGRTSDKFTLYDPVDPRDNVAEEGQVILLDTSSNKNDSSMCSNTEVIPDAAGYEIDRNIEGMTKEERYCLLSREIVRYKVGVNQVERGVKSVHAATGHGWDISYTPGHPVNIIHTGSEPIRRFDYVGVRFPLENDISAQMDRWNASTSRGTSICKFATYPIRENCEQMKCKRFRDELSVLADEIERGYKGANICNPMLEFVQLPSLLELIQVIFKGKEDDITFSLFEELVQDSAICQENNIRKANILTCREGLQSLVEIAKAAIDFSQTLRQPHMIAQVLDFKCVQPQLKSYAECGDVMRCVML